MAKLKIVMRVWKKITSLPFIGGFILAGLDKWQGISFIFHEKISSQRYKDFNALETLNQYYEFSNCILGSHQIKNEILSFLEFAKDEQPRYVCEIGTADGGTNFLLSQALPSIKLMIGVDLYVKNQAKLQYFCRESQQLIFINGSSYSEITVNKVKAKLAGIKLDILFIDGDHTYYGVKQDFLMYKSLLRDGGLIVFHDIMPDYLTRYGKKTGRWAGEVPKFWLKIKQQYTHYEFVEDFEQDGLGIGVIRYYEKVSIPEDL